MTKIKNQMNIPLAFDYKFKKVFGDNDGIERLEAFIAQYFNIAYKEVHGNITILNGEKRKNSKKEKGGSTDVYLKLELQSGNTRIDLEVSDIKLSQSIIDRDVLYGASNLSTQLQKNQKYSTLEPMIVICFDKGFLGKNTSIIDNYMLRNKKGNELTDKLQIHHINIEKCYSVWYNKTINKYSKQEQNIIRLGALLCITNNEEFTKCLEEIFMEEEIKKNIEKANFALNDDEEINMWWYDAEIDRKLKKEAMLHDEIEYEKKKAREKGRKEGIKQTKEELVKNMLNKGISISDISEITGLSKEEIEKLREE